MITMKWHLITQMSSGYFSVSFNLWVMRLFCIVSNKVINCNDKLRRSTCMLVKINICILHSIIFKDIYNYDICPNQKM